MSVVGNRIHDCRVEAGMSVDQLAEKCGKNRATLYRYENDDIGNVPLQVITQIATILGVSPAYIVGWSDEKKPATQESREQSELDMKVIETISHWSADRKMAFVAMMKEEKGQS